MWKYSNYPQQLKKVNEQRAVIVFKLKALLIYIVILYFRFEENALCYALYGYPSVY